MHRRPLISSLGALLLATIGIASAQNAYTAKPMNVRAGPDREYPLVAQLDSGSPLDVHGCLSDWSWCDVSFDDNRGWVYAGGLSFVYQGERVPLYSYGPRLGLPILTFSLGSYWDDYYRGRPWYSQRGSWAHRRMPPHMRPSGRAFAGPSPMPNERRPVGEQRGARGEERGAQGEERGRAMPQEQRGGRAMPSGPTRQTRPTERGGRATSAEPMRQGRPPEQNMRGAQRGHAPEQRGHAPEQKRPPSHGGSNHEERGNRPPGSGH